MAQTKTSRPPAPSKSVGDELTAVEFNEMNNVVNNNADDINTQIGDIETQITSISNDVIAIEGSSTPIQSYASHELPETASTGTLAFNSSVSELVYFKNGSWNKISDNNIITIVSGFAFSVDTRNTQDPGGFNSSASNQFELPFVLGGTYDCTIDWDCDNPGTDTQTFNTVSGSDIAGPIVHTYAAEGVYLISISGVIEGFRFDDPVANTDVRDALKILNLQNFGSLTVYGGNTDTSAVKMFMKCRDMILTAPDVLDTSGSTDFLWMFFECNSITQMPLFDVSIGNRFWAMFRDCESLQTLPDFNFNNGEAGAGGNKFVEMVRGCTLLTTLDNCQFGDMDNSVDFMFKNCSNLTNIPPSCDFSNTTKFRGFMSGCSLMTEFPQYAQITNGVLFDDAWFGCALTIQAIEDILGALVANGRSNLTTGFDGGTNAAESTWTSQAQADVATLRALGWTITTN